MTTWTEDTPVTDLTLTGLEPLHRGKVRQMYDLGPDRLLMVATDRISAFDCILPVGIPGKGKVLAALSVAWFRAMDGRVDHHFLTEDLSDLPERFRPHLDTLTGRSLVVKRAERFDVECVVRGYLAGSGWKEYRNDGTVCGLPLPAGLRESDRLPEPIFTPSTKEDDGHDQNIPFETMAEIVGGDVAEELRRLSLSIYSNLAAYCETRGIIVADTKFEFGRVGDRITLIDEVLTPDSSRFWPQDRYEPGRSQESFDKQYVRDWLENSGWNKLPPAPSLPEEVVKATASRYREAYERLVDPAQPLRFTAETWR